LQFSEFGFYASLFVIFLYLLTVLNTFSTAIDSIIPCTSLVGGLNDKKVMFGSRGRQDFQDITNFPMKSFRVWVKKK
jgi:hypothetical protein